MRTLVAILLLAGITSAQTFWTKETKAEVGVFTTEVALDGWTTQVLLSRGCGELNPLARPMVTRGTLGQAGASAVGLGAVVGTSYLLHRLHHDKWAKWTLRTGAALEGANDVRQVYLTKEVSCKP
jgi:hypothetical protein